MSQLIEEPGAQSPPLRKPVPLQFKEASRPIAQSPVDEEEDETLDDHAHETVEEDASEAVMGCNRMVHRTLSRTSLKSQSRGLTQQKSSRSIPGPAGVAPKPKRAISVKSTWSTPGGLETTKERGSEEHGNEDSGNNEKRSSGDSGTHEEASPTDSDDGKIIVVDWEGPDDPENPKNWAYERKWAATAIVSAFTFITPVSSSMLAPVSNQIAQEFGLGNEVVIAMITSIFLLAYAVGPLFLAPLSEIYGRSRVLQGANLFFLIFNLACGFSQNTVQILVFRFLSGLGGSAPLAIGGGVLGDCWKPEERGAAIAIYSLAPLVGPAVGPVVGAWIGLRTTWRWVLWSVTITDAIIQVFGIFLLQETFAPVLLERKAKKVSKSLGFTREEHRARIRTPYENEGQRDWQTIFGRALIRPFAMLVQEPIIQTLAIYQAFVYGLMYLVLTTIPAIYGQTYHESMGIAGLHYIAIGLGFTVASQVNARMLDRVYKYYAAKNGGVGRPEYRLPSMVPGTIILPIGLLIFGWTAEKHVFWLVPDIGMAMIGAGVILNFQSIQTYVIDAFTLHAASAIAATAFLRSLWAFGFPLFAPAMYNALGYGMGDTILAICGIVLGCPAPYLFWIYGERLRSRSRYGKKHKADMPQESNKV